MPQRTDLKLPISISALFVLLVLANPAWIYSVIGWVDAWAYFGHAIDPIQLRNSMPLHPSGDLLPNILPASFLYAILPPLVANFAYKWLCFLISGAFFFGFIRREAGLKTALWATILLLMHRFFFIAMGSEYTDGRVILFLTASLYFLGRTKSNLSQILAGVFFACSAVTAVLSLVYGLPLLIFAVGCRWYRSSKLSFGLFLWPVAGFIGALISFAAIHWTYTGEFYFFHNTIEKADHLLGLVRGVQDINFLILEWLYPTIFGLFAFPVSYLVFEHRIKSRELLKQRFVFWLMNFSAFMPLVYLQFFHGQETLWQLLYFNQIIPITMACIAVTVIAPVTEATLDRRQFAWWTVGLSVTAYAVFLFASRFQYPAGPVSNGVACVFLAAGLVSAFFRKAHLAVLCAFLAVYFHMNLSGQGYKYLERSYMTSAFARSRSEVLTATYDWIQLVKKIDPDRKSWLWYNSDGEKYLLRGMAAASHLWQGRVYNERLPNVDIALGETGIVPAQTLLNQGLILITVGDEDFVGAVGNLRSKNIDLDCEEKIVFPVNDVKQLDVRRCRTRRR